MDAYDRIVADQDFCRALGRVTLAAARLESGIRVYLSLKNITYRPNATLGELTTKLEHASLVSPNSLGIFGVAPL